MINRIFVVCLASVALSFTFTQEEGGPVPVRPTAFAYHPDMLLHDAGAGHPESPRRLQAIVSHLKETELWNELLHLKPEPADEGILALVHPSHYLRTLRDAARSAPIQLDPDTRVSAGSYRAATLAAGAVLASVDAVMQGRAQNAFAAVRPPGHHAFPATAGGFCLINNVAVAARYLQQEHDIERILIVDWDAHHGNGTQAIFYEDPSVLYFSTHQHPYYPGTGAASETGRGAGKGSIINVPLRAGSSQAQIIRAFNEQLVPAAKAFEPEFVLISAGFDSHEEDPLAQLGMTAAGYAKLTEIVMAIAEASAQRRIVSVLEGGYDPQALARSVAAHLEALAQD
jgi:acetoin utilization deacetylase AcuC-like enzyme